MLFSSCLPAHYIHTPLIVSDVEKKGDYNISGSFATSSETKNFNFTGNYALTNHWILHSSITNRNDYSNESKYDSKGSSFDVALGYTDISSDKNFYIENFVGYGIGKFKNIGIEDVNNFANFRYNKVFSQLNLNYRLNNADENTFSFHFPIRITYVHFNEINYNGTENGFEIRQIEFLRENPSKWMISIGKTISYRFNDVKLSVFGSYHSPTKADEFITFGNIYFGLGLSWRNFFKQKKEIPLRKVSRLSRT